MSSNKSREALIDFLDYLADKGLLAKNTALSRKASASKILGILSNEEAQDVTTLDLDAVMNRFHNLEGKKYTPGSLASYSSRLRSALDDFDAYLRNPMGFKPNVQRREQKSKSNGNRNAAPQPTQNTEAYEHFARRHQPSTLASSSIFPIPIRPDVIVHVQGIPFDLTEAEAAKIANVIKAMAMPT